MIHYTFKFILYVIYTHVYIKMPLPLISKFCKLLFSGVFSFSSKFHRPPWADLASPIISCQHERGRSTASRGPAAPVPKASPMFLGLSFQGHACHLEGERKALSGALSGRGRSSEGIALAPGVRWWSLGLVTVPGASKCSLRHANCASVNSQRTNRCPLPRPSQFLEMAHGGSLQETRGLVAADQDGVRQVAGRRQLTELAGGGVCAPGRSPPPTGALLCGAAALWAPPCARDRATEAARTWAARGGGLALGMSPGRAWRAPAVAACGRRTSRPRKGGQGVNTRGEGTGVL